MIRYDHALRVKRVDTHGGASGTYRALLKLNLGGHWIGDEEESDFALPADLLDAWRVYRDKRVRKDLVVGGRDGNSSPNWFGRWLGTRALGPSVRRALEPYATEERGVRLILQGPDEVLELPWERLQLAQDSFLFGVRPVGTHRWQLVRLFSDQEPRIEPPERQPLDKSVLLVIGDTRQSLENQTAVHEVRGIYEAIPKSLEVYSVADHAETAFQPNEELNDPSDLFTILQDKKPSIVHFVGHAKSGQLLFRNGRLRIAKLGAVLAEVGTRLLVMNACSTAGAVMREVLEGGGAIAAVGMGAVVDPSLCRLWSKEFYGNIVTPGATVEDAFREAGITLQRDRWNDSWIPLIGVRSLHPIGFPYAREEALRKYCEWLKHEHTNLAEIFTDVFPEALKEAYVEVEVQETRSAREEGEADTADRVVLRDLAEVSGVRFELGQLLRQRHRRWILAGGPGAGKTTALRWHSRVWAEDILAGGGWIVPAFLELPDWVDTLSGRLKDESPQQWLLEFVVRDLPVEFREDAVEALDELARDGRLTLFLDSFDELSRDNVKLFLEALKKIEWAWSNLRIVVATRRYSYIKILGKRYGDVDIVPLRPEIASEMLRKYLDMHSDWKGSRAKDTAESWEKTFRSGPPFWQRVSQEPLFVGLLALRLVLAELGHADMRTTVQDRFGFFEGVFRSLMKQEHKKDPQPLSKQKNAKVLLGWLAFRMTCAEKVIVEHEDLMAWLTGVSSGGKSSYVPGRVRDALADGGGDWNCAKEFLDVIQRRTLILGPLTSAQTRWKFRHRQFQEALTAIELRAQEFVDAFTGAYAGDPEACLPLEAQWWPEWARGIDSPDEAALDPSVVSAKEVEDAHEFLRSGRDAYRIALEEGAVPELEDRVFRKPLISYYDSEDHESAAKLLASLRAWKGRINYWSEPVAMVAARADSSRGVLFEALSSRALAVARRALTAGDQVHSEAVLALWKKADQGTRSHLVDTLLDPRSVHDQGVLLEGLLGSVQCKEDAYLEEVAQIEEILTSWRQRRSVEDGVEQTMQLVGEELGEILSRYRKNNAGGVHRSPIPDLLTIARRPFWCTSGPGTFPSEFPMGSPEGELGRFGDERLHTRRIERPYWIAAVPVTIAMFEPCDPSHITWCNGQARRIRDIKMSEDGTVPVTGVSWYKARHWCRWATEVILPGLLEKCPGLREPFATDAQLELRLPTEPEWEYAARAGTTGAFWFNESYQEGSKVLDEYGWFGEGEDSSPHPVATKTGGPNGGANPWGLFDVHGNVWEWCSDRYGPYPEGPGPHSDRGAPPTGALRVLRGGGYWNEARYCRSAFRYWLTPAYQLRDDGFRVVLAAVSSEGS